MEPTVSIVVPVKDREELVLRCLDSIAAQTVAPSRVVVVDNGSSDNTVQAVADWARRNESVSLLLLEESEPGAAAARNRGLAAVETDYVIFFDSDDEMDPGLVEKALDRAAASDADIVYWKAVVVGLDGRKFVKVFSERSLLRRQYYNSVLSTQVYMVRTSLVRRVGAWDVRALVWDDWELGIRLLREPVRVVALPEVLTVIHSQERSITGTSFMARHGGWELVMDMIEDKIASSSAPDDFKRRQLAMLDYRRVILAADYRKEHARREAAELLRSTFARGRYGLPRRLWLKLLYHYTALGGRGAYYLWY